MITDFLDSHPRPDTADERKRLAYADRAETLEQCDHRSCVYEVGGRWSCEYLPVCELQPQPEETYRPFARPWPCTKCGADADADCKYVSGAAMAGDYGPEIHVERLTPENPTPVQPVPDYPVSFTSVPQLCAAYEHALETLKRLYLIVDLKQHAFQSEQDVMRSARSLLLAAGKDVP